MAKEELFNNVYGLRQAAGITQEDLARVVGVSRQTVIAIEKGSYVPSVLLAIKISKFFKRPLEEVFYIRKG